MGIGVYSSFGAGAGAHLSSKFISLLGDSGDKDAEPCSGSISFDSNRIRDDYTDRVDAAILEWACSVWGYAWRRTGTTENERIIYVHS